MVTFASAVSYVVAAALVAAVAFFVARRWRLATALSSSATLASVAVLILLTGRFLAAWRSADPSSKVVTLTVSLSELMNCGALPLLVAVAGTFLWVVARRRLRT